MANRRRLISASDMVASEIRDLIYQGRVSSGDRLNPELLAAQLDVSKTPVRDALQSLRSEGLVEIVPRVGVFVRRMSKEEAADVYRLKAAIEPLVAGLAAERGDDAQRSQLQRMLRRLTSPVERGQVAKAEEAVNKIHQQLFLMARGEVFLETFRVVNGRVRLLRFRNMAQPGRLEATLKHHRLIVDAVIAGDSRLSAELMRDHLVDASRALQRALGGEEAVEIATA